MTAILMKLIEMSLQGSCLIMIILLIRMIWKKIPRKYICYLWYLVSIRLILPFSFNFIKQPQPANQMEEIVSKVATKVIYPFGEPKKYNTGGGWSNAGRRWHLDFQDWQNIIWLTVVAVICIYIIVSYIITRYRVNEVVHYRDNIYYCENVNTPFVFGYLRPRIYISYHTCCLILVGFHLQSTTSGAVSMDWRRWRLRSMMWNNLPVQMMLDCDA